MFGRNMSHFNEPGPIWSNRYFLYVIFEMEIALSFRSSPNSHGLASTYLMWSDHIWLVEHVKMSCFVFMKFRKRCLHIFPVDRNRMSNNKNVKVCDVEFDCIMSCSHVLSSCPVVMSCRHVLSSCPIVMSCSHVLSSCHVVMSCRHILSSCPVGMSCRHLLSSCPVVMSCRHVLSSWWSSMRYSSQECAHMVTHMYYMSAVICADILKEACHFVGKFCCWEFSLACQQRRCCGHGRAACDSAW